jgi:hypothetical protein
MRSSRIGFTSIMAACGMVAVVLLFIPGRGASFISGEVFDAVNGMPVYGARVTFDGRSTMLYLSKRFRLTSLARGDGVLRVTAPGYFEESRKLTIGGKGTEVSVPLRGREVPGLGGVLVWSKREGDDLRLDIRLTTAEGVGIEQFPSLPFGAEVRISENLGTLHEPIRGDLLFEGRPKLYLDLSSRLEKLKCKLGWNEIKEPRPGVTFGFLDFVLHTDQGTFRTTRGDIPLGKEGS